MSAPVSFGARVRQLAASHPDATAFVFASAPAAGELPVTWEALDRRADDVAAMLLSKGVGRGSLVVVALPNSPEHVFATVGAWRVGACVLPLRADLPQWERDRLLAVAHPSVVLSLDDVRATASSGVGASAGGRAVAPSLPDVVPDPAIALATSGSTGFPKLIISPGPGTFDAAAPTYQTSQQMGGGPGQTQLVPAPLYHANGFRITHAALHRDEALIVMERFDAARAVDLIEHHRVTTVTMAPTMLLRIARLPGIEQRDLSSLQSVLQGAGPCPPWLVEWWVDRVGPERFFISYGSSERVGITMIRGTEWRDHRGSVGKGLRTDVRILDDDARDVPVGEVGEIFMRQHYAGGPSYEYLGAPPAKQTADGFTSVGDMGWLDGDGYLYIADRRADMVVSGGANVYPAEVEAALLEHPAVADAAVIGLPDEEWGTRVHAIVVGDVTPDEVRAHCRNLLAAYKVPKTVEVVDALPRSEAGKLSRSALAAERR